MSKQFIRAAILVAVLAAASVCTTKDAKSSAATTGAYQHELALIHILAFSSWFGCSVWVSFIGGIVMFKNLPRHTFGRLQAKLFPAYFLFSAVLVAISIITSTALGWSAGTVSLSSILATILTNLVYFEPKTTAVMFERHIVERKLGTGHEVGMLKSRDPKIANDPDLKALSKKFGMLHGMSTLMNMAALGVGCYWINFLTQQIVAR
jgi:hypothetical protein